MAMSLTRGLKHAVVPRHAAQESRGLAIASKGNKGGKGGAGYANKTPALSKDLKSTTVFGENVLKDEEQEEEPEEDEEEEQDADPDFQASQDKAAPTLQRDTTPLSTSIRKRGSSGGYSTSGSAPKKTKSLVLGMWTTLLQQNVEGQSSMNNALHRIAEEKCKRKQEEKAEIKLCFKLARQCGFTCTTPEYMVLIKVFRDYYYRFVFLDLKDNESRRYWIQNAHQFVV